MATLIPSLEQINQFPTPLMPGERALMNALLAVLDETWTIYVQPFLNGLQPDIIILSEQAGMGIFEVKDWNLDKYQVNGDGFWGVYDDREEHWHFARERCPLAQVKRYKDSIIHYELAELQAEIVLNNDVYALIAPYVYFHNHSTQEAMLKTAPLQQQYPFISVFGRDGLQEDCLRRILRNQHLQAGSKFSRLMQQSEMKNRLLNALRYPLRGRLGLTDGLSKLNKEQAGLLPNEPGKRRVIGSAGSGKTLLVAHKAVNAALEGRKVLVVCYNITMVNYLNLVIGQLMADKNADRHEVSQRIFVRHYHRLYPNELDLDEPEVMSAAPFDVILIDEGQDFYSHWIENVYGLATAEGHVMFLEDDRQNIYGIDVAERQTIPGIKGRPNLLKKSYRINASVAAAANRLIAMSSRQFESGPVEPANPEQTDLLRPIWFEGRGDALLATLLAEVERLVSGPNADAFADIVILVCTVADGWVICEGLDERRLPYICSFESREEHRRAAKQYSGDTLKARLADLRRGRKLSFRMDTGRIKITTIHSFKGWELNRVLVYFNPTGEGQHDHRVPLLYTAMTRAQSSLSIFNLETTLTVFGQRAANQGLVSMRSVSPPASPGTTDPSARPREAGQISTIN